MTCAAEQPRGPAVLGGGGQKKVKALRGHPSPFTHCWPGRVTRPSHFSTPLKNGDVAIFMFSSSSAKDGALCTAEIVIESPSLEIKTFLNKINTKYDSAAFTCFQVFLQRLNQYAAARVDKNITEETVKVRVKPWAVGRHDEESAGI